MPTYEYACRKCGEHLEVVQSFSDSPLTECPACGGELRKVFGNVGIVFKGSGFYKTDSRTGSKASVPAKSSDAAGDSAASAPASKESSGSKESTAPKSEPTTAAAAS